MKRHQKKKNLEGGGSSISMNTASEQAGIRNSKEISPLHTAFHDSLLLHRHRHSARLLAHAYGDPTLLPQNFRIMEKEVFLLEKNN